MALLDLKEKAGFFVFDEEQCSSVGQTLNEKYVNASPFPHIVMDDFLDAGLLRAVAAEFPKSEARTAYNRDQERLKFMYGPSDWNGRALHNLLMELNSAAFVGFLEKMTGIQGLLVDPHYKGGGLHETKAGGHLGIHADFNLHRQLGVVRRLNLLIYLNDDWPAEYGGALELWDTQMTKCEVRALPVMGRAVVFTTSLDSFHGQPDPLACPPDRSRRSIAIYYYTAPENGLADLPDRTTNFRTRPGSDDKADWRIRWAHLVNDWAPPIVRRRFKAQGKVQYQ